MQPLDARLANALQAQHTQERANETAYQSIAQGFVMAGLEGFAHWAEGQANEEHAHAGRIADYLSDKRNVRAQMQALAAFEVEFSNPLEAFQAAANLEAHNTELILNLYSLADEVEDEDTEEFLLWFIREQRDSEAQFKNWIAQLQLIAGDGCGILAFDERLRS